MHLAGYSVTVLTTEREGGARSLVENLIGETDALIVAGGDGTLSEVYFTVFNYMVCSGLAKAFKRAEENFSLATPHQLKKLKKKKSNQHYIYLFLTN